MSLPFKPKSLICGLLGGLLLTLPLAQAEVTLQSLEPVTLELNQSDKSKLVKPVLEKPEPSPVQSEQTETFYFDHYALRASYADYSKLRIEEKPIALKGSLKNGNQAYLYTVQNKSGDALSLTLNHTLTPEKAMESVQDDRLFWTIAPVLLLPGSIYATGKILSFPGVICQMSDSTSKRDYVTGFIIFSILLSPVTLTLSALTLTAGVVGTVVLIPISLVKTPINLARAKRNDRLARQQIQSTDFKSGKATITLPPQATVQFAVLLQPKAESSKLPLFTIESAL